MQKLPDLILYAFINFIKNVSNDIYIDDDISARDIYKVRVFEASRLNLKG